MNYNDWLMIIPCTSSSGQCIVEWNTFSCIIIIIVVVVVFIITIIIILFNSIWIYQMHDEYIWISEILHKSDLLQSKSSSASFLFYDD